MEPRVELDLLDEFVRRLREVYWDDLVSVVLYGSYARGRATRDSDIDILVVCRNLPADRHARYARLRAAESALDRRLWELYEQTGWYPYLSVILKSTEEASRTSRIYFDMVEEGILLVDEGGFMRDVLDRVGRRMRELGSKKVTLPDGRWYWHLKPDLVWGEVFEI